LLERAEEVGYAAVQPIVRACARAGVSANAVTAFGVLVALATVFFLYMATPLSYAVAVLLILLNGVLDVVDGELARRTDTASARGDLLDHSADRYADAALVGGAAAGVGAFELGLVAVAGVIMVADTGAFPQAIGRERVYGGLLTRADILMLVVVGAVAGATGFEAGGYEPFVAVVALIAAGAHATVVQRALCVRRMTDDR